MVAVLVMLEALPLPGTLLGQSEGTTEYQVKAAFMFHFAQFVDWPSNAFKDPAAPLTYCTIGDDPFQGGLEQTLLGKTIGPRQLRVLHLEQAPQAQQCQILFVAVEGKRLRSVLEPLKKSPVLTVGDSENFAHDGGIIGFCLEEKKIRFDINLDAANQAELQISARLLALAKNVIGDPRGR